MVTSEGTSLLGSTRERLPAGAGLLVPATPFPLESPAREAGVEAGCFSGLSSSTPCSAAGGTSSGDRTINASADERV